MRKLLFLASFCAAFISCNEVDYDCPKDYKGWIIENNKLGGNYIISNGCEYKEVWFTPIYSYILGDTVAITNPRGRKKALLKAYTNNEIQKEHYERLFGN